MADTGVGTSATSATALAQGALTGTDTALDADFITKGPTNAATVAGILVTGLGVIAPALIAFLNNFDKHEALGAAAGGVIAAALLSLAWILAADLRARASVTSARFAGLVALANATAVATKASGTSDQTSQPTVPIEAVPMIGFDVQAHGKPQHLLAIGWSAGTDQAGASDRLLYLIAEEGSSGAPTWKTESEIDGVLRVKLSSPDS
jgi:hypothetical protein